MIEKKIHYIWVGGNPKPNLVDMCILNWKEKLPDYKIIEWNEENFDLECEMKKNRFLKECYDRKLWAFVSDYMRVKILYEHGGIYLDTDIQILKDITPLLESNFFIGYEKKEIISVGIFGCFSKHKYLKKILEFYESDIWNYDFYTIPRIFTHILKKNPELEGKIKIYGSEYFYPYYYNEKFSEDKIVSNTYCIHWWGKNWGSEKGMEFLQTKHLKGIKKMLKIIKIKLSKLKVAKIIYKKLKTNRKENE